MNKRLNMAYHFTICFDHHSQFHLWRQKRKEKHIASWPPTLSSFMLQLQIACKQRCPLKLEVEKSALSNHFIDSRRLRHVIKIE